MKILDQFNEHVAVEPMQVECEIAQLPRALAVAKVELLVAAPDQSKRWLAITWISAVITVILFLGLVYTAPVGQRLDAVPGTVGARLVISGGASHRTQKGSSAR